MSTPTDSVGPHVIMGFIPYFDYSNPLPEDVSFSSDPSDHEKVINTFKDLVETSLGILDDGFGHMLYSLKNDELNITMSVNEPEKFRDSMVSYADGCVDDFFIFMTTVIRTPDGVLRSFACIAPNVEAIKRRHSTLAAMHGLTVDDPDTFRVVAIPLCFVGGELQMTNVSNLVKHDKIKLCLCTPEVAAAAHKSSENEAYFDVDDDDIFEVGVIKHEIDHPYMISVIKNVHKFECIPTEEVLSENV